MLLAVYIYRHEPVAGPDSLNCPGVQVQCKLHQHLNSEHAHPTLPASSVRISSKSPRNRNSLEETTETNLLLKFLSRLLDPAPHACTVLMPMEVNSKQPVQLLWLWSAEVFSGLVQAVRLLLTQMEVPERSTDEAR